MSEIDDVLRGFAGTARDLQTQSQVLETLVRGPYFERAMARGLFPAKAEAEILALVEGVASAAEGAAILRQHGCHDL